MKFFMLRRRVVSRYSEIPITFASKNTEPFAIVGAVIWNLSLAYLITPLSEYDEKSEATRSGKL